ncbi:MAG: hypothetical protein JRN52_10505 [Nitrososphaerota archaeon]|nr:hypothetical protein [Nitrososphaerota archaeon]
MTSTGLRNKVEPTTSASQYLLRFVAITIVIILSSGAFLALRYDFVSLLVANMVVACMAIFLFSVIGQTLDKKLILLTFRCYKFLLKHGLLEEQYSD